MKRSQGTAALVWAERKLFVRSSSERTQKTQICSQRNHPQKSHPPSLTDVVILIYCCNQTQRCEFNTSNVVGEVTTAVPATWNEDLSFSRNYRALKWCLRGWLHFARAPVCCSHRRWHKWLSLEEWAQLGTKGEGKLPGPSELSAQQMLPTAAKKTPAAYRQNVFSYSCSHFTLWILNLRRGNFPGIIVLTDFHQKRWGMPIKKKNAPYAEI